MTPEKYLHTLKDALAYFETGNLAATEERLRTCIDARPDNATALHLMGLVRFRQNRLDDAQKLIVRSLELEPENTKYYNNLALVYIEAHAPELALEAALKASHLAPNDNEAQTTLGLCYQRSGNLVRAIEAYQKAVHIRPDHFQAHFNLGTAALDAGEIETSCTAFKAALSIAPDSEASAAGLGKALTKLGKATEAKQVLETFGCREDCGETIRLTLAECYLALRETDQAIALLKKTTQAFPGSASAWSNFGFALRDLSEFDEADKALTQALVVDPSHKSAQENLAHIKLANGEFEQGWTLYRNRHTRQNLGDIAPSLNIREWESESLDGHHFLAWSEQGLGDEILQASLISDLRKRTRGLSIICSARLHDLFRDSFPDVSFYKSDMTKDIVIDENQVLAAPLIDLAGVLRNSVSSFPTTSGYLKVSPKTSQKQRQQFLRTSGSSDDSALLIGISWESTNALYGSRNTIELEKWTQIFEVAKKSSRQVFFVCAQYGATKEYTEQISQLNAVPIICDQTTDHSGDMRDAATQVSAMDMVISTSTTTAQLAGALGVPTLQMTSYGLACGWYWMEQGTKTPWYPSMKLYRRGPNNSVDAQICEVAKDFATFISGHQTPVA